MVTLMCIIFPWPVRNAPRKTSNSTGSSSRCCSPCPYFRLVLKAYETWHRGQECGRKSTSSLLASDLTFAPAYQSVGKADS
ncbi:hypothetical protein AVEN_133449-1 [Araneus ventricosus]|uniref:Uncharacterized protein n=1 Tax=Araneus ventricosus TaxID=182803 RepID=A0A4Y2H8X4_ARAVE|nr:hypothetical protein AVEN_133449-1 [Araneus ventricosus]